MIRRINNIILMDDIIKKVKYSHTKDVVLVELKKSNFTVEFRNGKKNRAEIVKKMKLNKGEPVIIVGAKSDVSDLYVFGWDIKREGFINTGAYSIVRGTLEKIAGISQNKVLYVKNGDKLLTVFLGNKKCNFKSGDQISVACLSYNYDSCHCRCNEWNKEKCENCRKKNDEKRYIVLDIGGTYHE